jgi:type IV secretory pathway TraG/TraD family ATPase VirD4
MEIPIAYLASDPTNILTIPDDKHVSISGKTGTGKSTVLKNLIVEEIRAGKGVAVLDPHGQLVDDIVSLIPQERTRDVVWFDPADDQAIPGLNFYDGPGEDHKKVSAILRMFETVWKGFWGPSSNEIVADASYAVLAQDPDERSILATAKFLNNPPLNRQKGQKRKSTTYREKCLRTAPNFIVENWKRFSERSEKDQAQAVSHPMNKINEFIRNPLVRGVVGQTHNTLDMKQIMDEGKILLCRLSKGRLGADVSSILGSLIVSKISLAALERENVPEYKRRPFTLFADEVQNFVHGVDFPTILAEARKYHLTLVIATQTVSQLPDPEAVFGNCNVIVVYRIGGKDAEFMAAEWGNQFSPTAFMQLSDFEFYVSVVKDHIVQRKDLVWHGKPAITRQGNEACPAVVKQASRRLYANDRAEVMRRVDSFIGM